MIVGIYPGFDVTQQDLTCYLIPASRPVENVRCLAVTCERQVGLQEPVPRCGFIDLRGKVTIFRGSKMEKPSRHDGTALPVSTVGIVCLIHESLG